MDAFKNFKPKRERQLADFMTDPRLNDPAIYAPLNQVHVNVVEMITEINSHISKGELIAADDATQHIINLRSLRHDNWVEYLMSNRNCDGVSFGDHKVMEFLANEKIISNADYLYLNKQCRTEKEVNEHKEACRKYCIENELMDYDLMRKTPDILGFGNDATPRHLYIGDVTVTKSEGMSAIFKHEKYAPIAKWFKDKNYQVSHRDLIVTIDLKDLEAKLKVLVQSGLLVDNATDLPTYTHYHKAICDTIKLVESECADKEGLKIRLLANDRYEPVKLEQLKLDYDFIPFTPYQPSRSEEEIIDMIKRQTIAMNPEKYFDTGIEGTIEAFKGIIDANSKRDSYTAPKSVLKVVDNSSMFEELNGIDLVMQYTTDVQTASQDDPNKNYFNWMLPTPAQVKLMKEIIEKKLKPEAIRSDHKFRQADVYGPYHFTNRHKSDDAKTHNAKVKLKRGKKEKNPKKIPKSVNPNDYPSAISFINYSVMYYGSLSNKKPFLDDSWDSSTKLEEDESKQEREDYDYVRCTNGAQLCHSMAQFYNRIVHTSTSQGSRNMIYTPPNGSFVAIIPNNHGPTNRSSCDLPMYFMTRCPIDKYLRHIEYEYTLETPEYRYYVSKLCRLNIDKIAGWNNAGYQYVSSGSYLLSKCPAIRNSKERFLGLLTFMILDCHQKTSEYLDLLKYVSFMPFANIHKLPDLVADKFDLLMKTNLDVWLLFQMKNFVIELSETQKLEPKKPNVKIMNNQLSKDCLGLEIRLPTFCNLRERHNDGTEYIEEISLLYTSRPKHLYGSQFMDKAMSSICKWNEDYEDEVLKHGGWATNGVGEGDYPFSADFTFCSDAIYYANKHASKETSLNQNQVHSAVLRSSAFGFGHNNCSLKGCTKPKSDRANSLDLHSTSMDEILKMYRELNYDDKECTVVRLAMRVLKNDDHVMQFTKSEKEQRGGGRPIATPTLLDKMGLMFVEKPEVEKGMKCNNNIIVPGKNKLKEQADNYKNTVVTGTIKKFKYIAQVTEDQSKFSEMDNTRKFITYLRCDTHAPVEVRQMQIDLIRKLENREHLVKRLPTKVTESYSKWVNEDRNGVRAIIGWPQGMLNFISTSVHSDADYWILKAYNMAFPDDKVYSNGLVHSDDSAVVVCFNDPKDFRRFVLFRSLAKRMFCLKLNIKKLWGSVYFGEIVSNYNMNGNVHMSVAKTIANSFGNLTFLNWPTDVSNQISTIQQCYRNGATVPTLIMMATVLRQQMISSYQVKGLHRSIIHNIPVDLGGYPDNSAFELGVTGVTCHYKRLIEKYQNEAYLEEKKMVLRCLKLAKQELLEDNSKKTNHIIISNSWAEQLDSEEKAIVMSEEDFERIVIPGRGNVFTPIKYLLPKSSKVKKTIRTIQAIPHEPTGLEELVTRPKTLAEALGNLKSQTSNMFYQLASENYTQSSRRMAMSQTMQSSGRVVCINGSPPITMNQMLESLRGGQDDDLPPIDLIKTAFSDDNDLISLCSRVVYKSEHYSLKPDKRRVLNRMPYVDDKFNTIAPLNDVLLYIVQKNARPGDTGWDVFTKYSSNRASITTVENDADLVVRRFMEYFSFYNTIAACSLIKRQYLSSVKSKLWVQPHLKNDSLIQFIESLYGKTVSNSKNFGVIIRHASQSQDNVHKAWLDTIYTTEVINTVYPGQFRCTSVEIADGDKTKSVLIGDFIRGIDYESFDANDKLKLGVLNCLFNKDDNMLRRCIRDKRYSQEWQMKQKLVNGKYTGRFNVLVKYDNTILRIKGTPGNLTIKSSTTVIHKIQAAMKMFVDQNFRSYSYSNPAQWGSSDFWRTNNAQSNCLIYVSAFYTRIGYAGATDVKCVEFDHEPGMQFQSPDQYYLNNPIVIEDNLRTVSIKVGPKKYRVGNIFQNLCLPNSRHINLLPCNIDGMNNIDLYNTETILNLILDRKYNVSTESAKTCLLGSDRYSSDAVKSVFKNLLLKMRDGYEFPDDEDIEPPIMMEEFVLEGQTSEQYVELQKTSKVEELSPDALLFDYGLEAIRHEKILTHRDITRAVCVMYSGSITAGELDDFVKYICNDDQIIIMIKEIMAEYKDNQTMGDDAMGFEKFLDFMFEYGASSTVSLDLFSFIKASSLDKYKYWADRDIRYIIKEHQYTDYNRASGWGFLFKSEISEIRETTLDEKADLLTIVNV